MRHIGMFSGGYTSFGACKRVAEWLGHPPELLFTDTLIEDDDLYRFVVEAAANVLGISDNAWRPLRWLWETIPPLEEGEARGHHMMTLASEAMHVLPGLQWLHDGRDPWQVFRDVRFLGNSRVAKCSHVLKQDVARRWLEENCDVRDTTIYLGIHGQEIERFVGSRNSPGARELWKPWLCEAPLCGPPLLGTKALFDHISREGIRPPRLYGMGFTHNNCGGFCVRAGQGHFKLLLEKMPERYAYHERREEELRQFLGKDVTILRLYRGGRAVPITLRQFREMIEAGEGCDRFDVGGCGCFVTADAG